MKLYEAIADALVREGVDVLFTLIDDPILPLVQELLERGVRIVSARHEQAAVAMADGYARVARRIGVCAIGAGPAIAQTGTALVTARRNGTPLLVLAGDTPATWRHHVKRFDQESFIRATAGADFPLREQKDAASLLGQALRHIRSGGGPAVISLPSNLIASDVTESWHDRGLSRAPPPAVPDAASVAQAARLLAAARMPILLAGGGALASGAGKAIEALAERTGALLATTMQAREWFRGHPANIGLMGSFATPRARPLFGRSDLLVAIGTSLNPYIQGTAYGSGLLSPTAKVIHIDSSAGRIGEYCPADVALVGDAKACVEALEASLAGAPAATADRGWRLEAKGADELPTAPTTKDGALTVHDFLAALEPLLPAERTVAVDCGLFVFPLVDQIHCPAESFLWTMSFGSIGMALATGLGAAVARPDRPCFVFVGDGGFTTSPQELMTAAHQGIPLTVVILDDGGYGAEARILKERQKPVDLALLKNPDLANLARALGAEAVTVRTLHDLAEVKRLVDGTRTTPLVIHALVKQDEWHRAMPS